MVENETNTWDKLVLEFMIAIILECHFLICDNLLWIDCLSSLVYTESLLAEFTAYKYFNPLYG